MIRNGKRGDKCVHVRFHKKEKPVNTRWFAGKWRLKQSRENRNISAHCNTLRVHGICLSLRCWFSHLLRGAVKGCCITLLGPCPLVLSLWNSASSSDNAWLLRQIRSTTWSHFPAWLEFHPKSLPPFYSRKPPYYCWALTLWYVFQGFPRRLKVLWSCPRSSSYATRKKSVYDASRHSYLLVSPYSWWSGLALPKPGRSKCIKSRKNDLLREIRIRIQPLMKLGLCVLWQDGHGQGRRLSFLLIVSWATGMISPSTRHLAVFQGYELNSHVAYRPLLWYEMKMRRIVILYMSKSRVASFRHV